LLGETLEVGLIFALCGMTGSVSKPAANSCSITDSTGGGIDKCDTAAALSRSVCNPTCVRPFRHLPPPDVFFAFEVKLNTNHRVEVPAVMIADTHHPVAHFSY
jgi:hypothetical protein